MKKILCIALALVLCLGLSAPALADWDGITLKISHNLSSTDVLQTALEAAAEKIAEESDGKVKIEVYPNGELLSYADAVEAIMSDSAVVYYCGFGDWADYYPDAPLFANAYAFDSNEQFIKFMDTDVYAKAVADMDAVGIHCLQAGFSGGFRQILTNKKVENMADLKGLSIRVPATVSHIGFAKDIGMVDIGMAWSETLTAVSQGSIDCVEGTWSTIVNYNLWDYFKYVVLNDGILQAECLWMSPNVWNSIPEEYQAIIKAHISEAQLEYVAACEEKEEEYKQACLDHGMELLPVDKAEFAAACTPRINNYSIGQETLDVLATLK